MPLTDEQYKKGAIAHINKKTGQSFEVGSLPGDIEVAVDMLIASMKEKANVQSQSLGDMSKSFFEGATYKAAMQFVKPYKKAGFK